MNESYVMAPQTPMEPQNYLLPTRDAIHLTLQRLYRCLSIVRDEDTEEDVVTFGFSTDPDVLYDEGQAEQMVILRFPDASEYDLKVGGEYPVEIRVIV